MLNLNEIVEIVSQITYKDWIFYVNEKNGVPYLQIQFYDICSISKKKEIQKCRKWQLSYHMVRSEVVRTAYKALLAAVEHEAAENFKYKGARIFNPHFDLDNMVDFCKKENISVRE